jgi:hypothetical protein
MHRHNYKYVCMYYLHVNIFPHFVFSLPSSMHTHICEAPCVQVDPKPERASADFGFKSFFSIFGGRPLFELFCCFQCRFCTCAHAHVRVCMRTCTHLFSCNKAYRCTVYACPYTHTHTHIYIYMYVYICTHTHTQDTQYTCMHHDDACTDL